MSTPPPGDGSTKKNPTTMILAAALAVIAVVAVALLGWIFLGGDSEDNAEATATSTSTTSSATDTSADPTSPAEDEETTTVSNTVEETVVHTVEQTVEATEPAGDSNSDPNAPGAPTELPADICAISSFHDSGLDYVTNVGVCDNGWARGGPDSDGQTRVFQWNNGRWEAYPPAGQSTTTGDYCYDPDIMAQAGAPRVLLMETLDCASTN